MIDTNREITLRFLAQPTDVNFGGKVHGGSVMKWLDEAGYVCATTWSGSYCVTAFVGDMNFRNPIHIGDLVEVHAKIIHTGRSSMHIALALRACSPRKCVFLNSIRCLMVFVAVDEENSTVQVPAWQPISQEDIALEEYAKKSKALRIHNREELELWD